MRRGAWALASALRLKTDWFLPETLGDDAFILRRTLAPALIGRSFSHPREIADYLVALPKAADHPMAVSALESACWDLHGRIAGKPFWKLLNEEYERLCICRGRRDLFSNLPRTALTKGDRALVGAGAVVGLGQVRDVLEQVAALRRAGYRRVKMKVAPGSGFEAVPPCGERTPSCSSRLTRTKATPSETSRSCARMTIWGSVIEEPLAPRRADSVGRRDAIARLARLQREIATPCASTSRSSPCKRRAVCHASRFEVHFDEGRKFGGVEPALRFIVEAQSRGCEVYERHTTPASRVARSGVVRDVARRHHAG